MATADSDWSDVVGVTVAGTPWPQRETGMLYASDPTAGDLFGRAVALNAAGDLALVGAYRKNNDLGGVYTYTRSGASWVFQQQFSGADSVAGDQYGASIAVSADASIVLIGAPGRTENSIKSGAVYVYQRVGTSYQLQQKLVPPSLPAANMYFGVSVAVSADGVHAIIGANGDTDKGVEAGAVYYFKRSGAVWTGMGKYYSPDPGVGEHFGRSLAVSSTGEKIFVGAPLRSTKGIKAGAVGAFTRSDTTLTFDGWLFPAASQQDAKFGMGLACDQGAATLFVGAYREKLGATVTGVVHVLAPVNGVYTDQQQLQASDPTADGDYGVAVALNKDASYALVGAVKNSLYSDSRGLVYTLE